VAGDEAAYFGYVRNHRDYGFTDFLTVAPRPADRDTFRRIALERIPELRAEFAAAP
jgi:hypothetical protein